MTITYYGASCFKVQSKELTFVFDPPSKKSELKSPRFKADIVFISHDHPNHNGKENLAEGGFLIDGPGEYELKGILAKGIESYHDSLSGKKRGRNVIYLVESEGVKLCHLGDFGEPEISAGLKEKIGQTDILFVPIDPDLVPLEKVFKIINQLEPKLVVPMHHYFSKNHQKNFQEFLKEFNGNKIQEEEKLVVKSRELKDREGFDLRVLKQQI